MPSPRKGRGFALLQIDDAVRSRLSCISHASPSLEPQSGLMRKDVAGAGPNQAAAGRWPVALSSAAQLLGEVAAGMVAGAPGVLAYRSVVVPAAQQVESTLRHFSER